jgi:molecular chaperone GrpE
MVRRGKRELLLKLLDVVDNFNRALAAKDADAAALRTGLEVLLRQMEGILSAEGVQAIESVGKTFDPSVHEAVAVWNSPEVKEDTVTDEIQRGYTYEGDVLRVARVRVAQPAGGEPKVPDAPGAQAGRPQ